MRSDEVTDMVLRLAYMERQLRDELDKELKMHQWLIEHEDELKLRGFISSGSVHLICDTFEEVHQAREALRSLGPWTDRLDGQHMNGDAVVNEYVGQLDGVRITIRYTALPEDMPKGLLKDTCKIVEGKPSKTIVCEVN